MSNTFIVALTDTVWTEVASGSVGFITNEGQNKLKYRESDILPVDTEGHTMEREVAAYVSFSLESGQKVYLRAATGATRAAITID